MRIVRASTPTDHFTIISNAAARSEATSLRARGLLLFLLSHNEGWSTSTLAIAQMNREGRDSIRNAMRELEDAGYVVRTKRRGESGRWEWTLEVSDLPAQGASFQPTIDAFSGDGAICTDRSTIDAFSGAGGSGHKRKKNIQEERDSAATPRGPHHDEAHRLTVIAFEQPVKPDVARAGKAGAFPAVMSMLERRLKAGVSPEILERCITNGEIVWSIAGLQTAEARAGTAGVTVAGRTEQYVNVILHAVSKHGRNRRPKFDDPDMEHLVNVIGWGRLCAMTEFDAQRAIIETAKGQRARA